MTINFQRAYIYEFTLRYSVLDFLEGATETVLVSTTETESTPESRLRLSQIGHALQREVWTKVGNIPVTVTHKLKGIGYSA